MPTQEELRALWEQATPVTAAEQTTVMTGQGPVVAAEQTTAVTAQEPVAATQAIQQEQVIAEQPSQAELQTLWESAKPVEDIKRRFTPRSLTPLEIARQMTPEQVSSHIERTRRKSTVLGDALDNLGQFGEGLRRAGEGFAQTALQVGEMLGFNVPRSDVFTGAVQQRREGAQAPEGMGGLIAQIAGEAAPSMMVPPVVKGGAWLSGLSNAAVNAGLSSATFTPPGESKVEQALLGAALGGATEFGAKGLKQLGVTKQETKDMVETFSEAGTTPTVGQATGNTAIQAAENTLAKVFGGQGISANAAARAQRELGQTAEDAATALAQKKTDEMAGGLIRKGLNQFADDFKAESEVLYRRLYDFVPPEQSVPVSNSLKAFEDLTRITPGAEKTTALLASSSLKDLADAFSGDAVNGVLPFSALQEVRSSIGRKLATTDLVSDYSKGELKKLYGAITRDMEQAAIERGGQEAFKRANNYYRAGLNRIDSFLTPLSRKTEDIDIYNALTAAGKKGTQKLNAVKRSVPIKQWETFVGSRIKDLGLASPGAQGAAGDVWSSANFLTNWNKITPGAKRVMFSGSPELVQYGKNMDSLAKAAERIKEAAKVMSNPSGTSGQLSTVLMGGLGGAGAATGELSYPLIAGILMGTAGAGSKILTNPKVVNAITKLPSDVPPTGLSGLIGRGTALYSSQDDETRGEIDFLLSEIQNRS